MRIKKQVSREEWERLRELGVPGMEFEAQFYYTVPKPPPTGKRPVVEDPKPAPNREIFPPIELGDTPYADERPTIT